MNLGVSCAYAVIILFFKHIWTTLTFIVLGHSFAYFTGMELATSYNFFNKNIKS